MPSSAIAGEDESVKSLDSIHEFGVCQTCMLAAELAQRAFVLPYACFVFLRKLTVRPVVN